MLSTADLVIIDDFYANPDEVRKYALGLEYMYPWDYDNNPRFYSYCSEERKSQMYGFARGWATSRYRPPSECPFLNSEKLLTRLADITGGDIDRDYWNNIFPVKEADLADYHQPGHDYGCETARPAAWWNCLFHQKFDIASNAGGTGVHIHSVDPWNDTGPLGWAGVVFLSHGDRPEGGLSTWAPVDGRMDEWTTEEWSRSLYDPSVWRMVDQIAYRFNRLVLHRGYIPHTGGYGWGELGTGRLLQTFFFRSAEPHKAAPLAVL